jgi:hypothetical protein
MSNFPFNETRYGFDWGPLKIERIASDPKFGVVVFVGSEREQYELRVTPKGNKVLMTKREHAHWTQEGEV